ncbi:hypothetical protein C0992_001741, partial [Termitomyces sp. T32_za158]
RQQLAAKMVAGEADLHQVAMETEAEQVRAAVAAREWREEREAAGAGASTSAGASGGAGADAPGGAGADASDAGTGADTSGAGAGFRLHSPAIIGTQSEGTGSFSPQHCQAGGTPSLAPLVGKGKALAQEVVRPKSQRADVKAPLYKVPKQTIFSDNELCELLVSQRKEAKLDLGMAAGVVIDEAKGKTTVAPAQQRTYKRLKGMKPCTYDGLKSQERGKADKAIERIFQKAILVWRAHDFVEVQWVVKAAGRAPVISDLSLALPMGQGRELVSTAAEEAVKAPPSQSKDKGKGKAITKDGNGEKKKKRERPLTGNHGAPCKRQVLDEFGAGPSSHCDPSAAPPTAGQLEVVVLVSTWCPVQDWECQLVAAWKAADKDRAAKVKAEKEKEKEGGEKAAKTSPIGTPTPQVSVRRMPVPTPHVTTEDLSWLGKDLEYLVSAFASASDLEVLMARMAAMEALIRRELVVVNTEMAELWAC